jgi:hypothetical protein
MLTIKIEKLAEKVYKPFHAFCSIKREPEAELRPNLRSLHKGITVTL